MLPFIEKMFGAKVPDTGRIFSALQKISGLSDEANKKKKEISKQEYSLILENKDDYYISLTNFLKLIDNKELSLRDISACCTHITELKNKVSVVEVHAISENGHIVLCSDTKNCDKHKGYAGDKLRIVSLRAGINVR